MWERVSEAYSCPSLIHISVSPPPPVFHYQVKVHFFSKTKQSFTEQPMKISLYGSHGEKENIPFVLYVCARVPISSTLITWKRNSILAHIQSRWSATVLKTTPTKNKKPKLLLRASHTYVRAHTTDAFIEPRLTDWLPSPPPRRPLLNSNTTLSFLITTDEDIGDLLMVKLRWEKDTIISWSGWWSSSQFYIRKLRIKSGETQSKWVSTTTENVFMCTTKRGFLKSVSLCDWRVIFSAKDGEFADLVRGGDEGVFVKMKEDNMSRKEKL